MRHVVHLQHRMGVAHGHGADVQRLAVQVQGVMGGAPRGIEGDVGGFEARPAHVHPHLAVGQHPQFDQPGAGLHRDDSRSVSPWSRTKRAKQRAPLPHCSTSPPSALKMR
jgi:hypothetical protein